MGGRRAAWNFEKGCLPTQKETCKKRFKVKEVIWGDLGEGEAGSVNASMSKAEDIGKLATEQRHLLVFALRGTF